jgi:hypothetical protein
MSSSFAPVRIRNDNRKVLKRICFASCISEGLGLGASPYPYPNAVPQRILSRCEPRLVFEAWSLVVMAVKGESLPAQGRRPRSRFSAAWPLAAAASKCYSVTPAFQARTLHKPLNGPIDMPHRFRHRIEN